jgi:drug/metabolite transporter (DMT)-like permease
VSVSAPRPRSEPSTAAFAPLDWALLGASALTWGSSFLFIDIAVDHFSPGLVAFLRVFFGALVLAAVPGARTAIPRSDWPAVALLGVIWMAVPFVLFSVALQWIDSSVAGMIIAATPLFTAVVASVVVRDVPGGLQVIGLVVGFLGVVAITSPSFGDEHSSVLGVALVLLAAALYGCAYNLAGPLQRRNGALPVILRAELVSLVLLTPVAAGSVPSSGFAWGSLAATLFLGAAGTALAYVWFATLVGRVGSTRGSITVYLLPVVAIALGVTLRDEPIYLASLLGTALVVAGAYLTSREEQPRRAGLHSVR